MRALTAISHGMRHATGAFVEAAVIVAIAAALAIGAGFVGGQPAGAGPVEAGQRSRTAATMVANPAPVAAGEVLHVQGGGLNPDHQAWVRTETATAVGWLSLGVASDGTYDIDLSFRQRGDVRISVYQVVNKRSVMVSSCTVLVQ